MATDTTQQKNSGELLDPNNLPSGILDWIGSEHAVYLIIEINKKLGVKGGRLKIVPRLIARLLTKDLDPKDFINELSREFNISFESAKSVTGDIIKSVLGPIETDLKRDLGIDIRLINFGKPEAPQQKSEKSPGTEQAESPSISRPAGPQGSVIDLQSFRIKSDRPISPLNFPSAIKEEKSAPAVKTVPPAPAEQKNEHEIPPTPFILHQENPTSMPEIGRNSQSGSPAKPQEFQAGKTSLTMKVQNFYQSNSGVPEKTAVKPIPIKVEMPYPGQDFGKTEKTIQVNRQDAPPNSLNNPLIESSDGHSPKQNISAESASAAGQEPRVVHYSNLRTPINSVGLPKNVVDKDNILDLRKIVK